MHHFFFNIHIFAQINFHNIKIKRKKNRNFSRLSSSTVEKACNALINERSKKKKGRDFNILTSSPMLSIAIDSSSSSSLFFFFLKLKSRILINNTKMMGGHEISNNGQIIYNLKKKLINCHTSIQATLNSLSKLSCVYLSL